VSKVLLDMSVSLDRFVAGANGEDVGLHDWFFSPAGGEAVAESVRNTGVILLGRQIYDQGDGLDGFAGSPYAVEHFVVTHRAPERAAKGEMTFTFVTEGVEGAVERANSPLGASPLPTRPPNGGSRRRIHAKADDGEGAPGVLSRAARGRAQRRQGRRPAAAHDPGLVRLRARRGGHLLHRDAGPEIEEGGPRT
jgi:hypothetical protein